MCGKRISLHVSLYQMPKIKKWSTLENIIKRKITPFINLNTLPGWSLNIWITLHPIWSWDPLEVGLVESDDAGKKKCKIHNFFKNRSRLGMKSKTTQCHQRIYRQLWRRNCTTVVESSWRTKCSLSKIKGFGMAKSRFHLQRCREGDLKWIIQETVYHSNG